MLVFEEGGRIAPQSEGNYDYYLEKKRRAANHSPSRFTLKPNRTPVAKEPPAPTARSAARKLKWKEEQELARPEAAITKSRT